MQVPSDYRLGKLQCNFDEDQDPEVWVCQWVGQTVPDGAIIGGDATNEPGDEFQNAMDAWLDENEYTLL